MILRNWMFVSLLILLGSCATEPIPRYGGIEGRVFSVDGSPLQGAKVAVKAPGYSGRYPTNSDGVVRLMGVSPGKWKMEFHCPSAHGVGKLISEETVVVKESSTAHVDVEVPARYCYEPPYAEVVSTFTGYISHGFERSQFSPCNEASLNLSKNLFFAKADIWVDMSRSQYEAIEENALYFVRVKGTLKGPGRFGHMGVSVYLLDLDSIIYKQKVKKEDCARHDR